jgi:hypothetical protein
LEERQRGCADWELKFMPLTMTMPENQPDISYAATIAGAFVSVRDQIDCLIDRITDWG